MLTIGCCGGIVKTHQGTNKQIKRRQVKMLYKTRYQAQKAKKADEKVIKVDGGYMVMTQADYQIWRKQK